MTPPSPTGWPCTQVTRSSRGSPSGFVPQVLLNVKPKVQDGSAAQEIDLLVRVAYSQQLVDSIGLFVEVLPGYSLIHPPNNGDNSMGLVLGFGGGVTMPLSDRAFATLRCGLSGRLSKASSRGQGAGGAQHSIRPGGDWGWNAVLGFCRRDRVVPVEVAGGDRASEPRARGRWPACSRASAAWLASLSDAQLVVLAASVLFVLAAWPLLAGRAAAAPGPAQPRRHRAHRGAPRPLSRVHLQRSLALERAAHALVPGVGRAGPVRRGAAVRRGGPGRDRARAAALPAALPRAARSVGVAALRLAAGSQLLGGDGVPELRVRVRAVADSRDRRRSPARRGDPETWHRNRGAFGRDLVRASVPARGRGRPGGGSRRRAADLARARGRGRRAPVADRSGGAALRGHRAPPPGEGGRRHGSAGPAFAFLNPWETLAHLWTDVSGALTPYGEHDHRAGHPAALVRLERTTHCLVADCRSR